MGYTSKYKGAEIDALLDKVEALPEGGGEGGSAPMMIEVTWEELVALRDAANLTTGQMYRITDYETFCAWGDTQCAGHPFDIIVTALDNKTLDEKASAIWSARDTEGYFANSNLPAWDVRYCLDNDTERFGWAVVPSKIITVDLTSAGAGFVSGVYNGIFDYEGTSYTRWDATVMDLDCYILTNENVSVGDTPILYLVPMGQGNPSGIVSEVKINENFGKGVIYRLIDDVNNDVSYDFKNIMFSRKIKDGVYDVENGVNTYVYTFSSVDADNLNVFDYSITNKGRCHDNVIEADSYDNVFLNILNNVAECYSNHIERACMVNTFGNDCYGNHVGAMCGSNVFSEECYENVLDRSCSNNKFGFRCHHNIIGYNSQGNTFEERCAYNHCGYFFNDNKLGSECEQNTFGHSCYDITFKDGCRKNTLGVNCRQLVLQGWCGTVKSGTSGKSGTININFNSSYDYSMTAGYNKSGELKTWCEADLVQ